MGVLSVCIKSVIERDREREIEREREREREREKVKMVRMKRRFKKTLKSLAWGI